MRYLDIRGARLGGYVGVNLFFLISIVFLLFFYIFLLTYLSFKRRKRLPIFFDIIFLQGGAGSNNGQGLS